MCGTNAHLTIRFDDLFFFSSFAGGQLAEARRRAAEAAHGAVAVVHRHHFSSVLQVRRCKTPIERLSSPLLALFLAPT